MRQHSLFRSILFVQTLLFIGTPRAVDSAVPDNRPLLLLLLGTASDGAVESDFRVELSLWLESHRIEVLVPFAFAADTHLQRMQEIRPLVEETGAEMVLWIERMDADRFALQVLSMARGRGISRSAEVPAGAMAGSELAIAARELMQSTEEIAGDAVSVSDTHASGTTSSSKTRTYRMVLGLGGTLTSGIVASGAKLRIGGGLSMALQFDNGLFGMLSVSGDGLPKSAGDITLRSGGIAPGLGVGWLGTVSAFSLGPLLLLEVPFQRVTVSSEETAQERHDWWTLRGRVVLDLRWRLASRVGVFLRPGMGVSVFAKTFQRQDGSVLYAGGILDWSLYAGALVFF